MAGLPRSVQRVLAGPPRVVDRQQLDPEVQLLIRLLGRASSHSSRTVAEARTERSREALIIRGVTFPVERVEELTIRGPEAPIPAPEHPFPAAVEGDRTPAFCLSLYPVTDLSTKRRSYRLFGEGFVLTEARMDWYRSHYLPDDAAALDPRASPVLAQDLTGLPPAYVATAGFDPLRDEGEEYARRLRDAGVPVALRRHPGLVHGFVNAVGSTRFGRVAMEEAAGALRVGLARARVEVGSRAL